EMAEFTGLLPLYNFLYAATSQFVHYSPSNLLRMGRKSGGGGAGSAGGADGMAFSTAHFAEYYNSFNRFYGLFLFITFCTPFAARLGCAKDIKPGVEKLMRVIDEELRWPELVTMEEMDLPSVS